MAVARIDALADESHARVTEVVARYERTLLRVARQASLCHDDALDAYQRALEIFVRRVDTVDRATEVAWLKVVVRHEAMAIRRARVESVPGDELDLDAFVPAERSVEEKLLSEERVRRSAEALRALKPDEAKALMMKAHGLSYAEIGERNGWSYTNVMATVAVFIALGGSSYAALQIDSGDIANNSVRGVDVRNRTLSDRDVKRNGLTGRGIRESRLGRVPHAREADRLGGMTAADLLLKCPEGTFLIADVCVETTPRSAVPYGAAVVACATAEPTRSPGRRLPTYGELRAALSGVQLAPGGELTAEVYPSSARPGDVDVLVVNSQGGGVEVAANNAAKAFRCATDPRN